jgi:ectoine hydroxylase-related dioxygenase (phytanoyl-CoA dioxygenase family)
MRSSLCADQLAAYRDEGYLVLHKLFGPDEVAALAAEADQLLAHTDLIDANNLRTRWQPHHETGQLLFEVFDPVIDIAPFCAGVAFDDRIQGVLIQVYGEQACLFKDKLIFKPPGANGYGLHQDYIGWPGFPKTFVTVVIAIDPFDASSGGTEVFPGYHKNGFLGRADGRYYPITKD